MTSNEKSIYENQEEFFGQGDVETDICTYCSMELISPSYTWRCVVCGRTEQMERCYKCGSLDTSFVDEYYGDFEDKTGDVFSLPVGVCKCRECRTGWEVYDWTDDDGNPLKRIRRNHDG